MGENTHHLKQVLFVELLGKYQISPHDTPNIITFKLLFKNFGFDSRFDSLSG